MLKKFLAAAAALSLAVSPAAAQVDPGASALATEQGDLPPGWPVAAALSLAIGVFAILLATGSWPFDDDEESESP